MLALSMTLRSEKNFRCSAFGVEFWGASKTLRCDIGFQGARMVFC